jgi:hypothetical protein
MDSGRLIIKTTHAKLHPMNRYRTIALFALCAVVLAMTGCSSSGGGGGNDEPEIKKHGKYVVEYRGRELNVEVSYRWAEVKLGDEWMVLGMTLTGSGGSEGKVDLDNISLRSPAGYTLVPITREEFRHGFQALRSDIRRSDAWNAPAETFGGVRQPCGRWFYAPPGELGHKTLYMNPAQICFGPMVFQIPGGIQPGRYVLIIKLQETDVRIPFTLAGPEELR